MSQMNEKKQIYRDAETKRVQNQRLWKMEGRKIWKRQN